MVSDDALRVDGGGREEGVEREEGPRLYCSRSEGPCKIRCNINLNVMKLVKAELSLVMHGQ